MSATLVRAIACALALTTGTARARELRVCADPNNMPFSNRKGEGFENKLAELVASELGASVTYTWHAQRRGFIRETLRSGACDLVPGIASSLEGVLTTAPYYRSTYVFVTRENEPDVTSFNDPVLQEKLVGVQLVGDDGWNTPPAHALSRRGITNNVRGYPLYGDYEKPNPPARIVEAVSKGEIDVAVAWGPLAGYFAKRESVPLRVTPVRPRFDGPQLPMVWDISMAVRKEDDQLWKEVDGALRKRRSEIDAILATYGVPRADRPATRTGAAR